ncbi:DUF5819 family protein [Streptomyces yaanensis]|uniref:DUF5819 family protein n=1 Tax=Streptomyces yaanensis TaxID=1142239 RepID=A0ABV7SG91_9ACTN|nr:DUF5819 family protein [Streptomyces sp. CGMCC 4.7035]WNB97760.1 DUF5819 family protein [Streptomyces sp. CGMCC 4.7035]
MITGTIVVAATAVAVHLLLVFLYLAPANAISRKHADLIRGWVYPEFDQNWQLFAPNPLQTNITVHARAQIKMPDGSLRTTPWVNLTAQDIAHIKDNPAPSHAYQNLLRQAWDFYNRQRDATGKAVGLRGELGETYVRRIAAQRLSARFDGGRVVKVQIYSAYAPIASPKWSNEKVDTRTTYQSLPWWPISKEDLR